MWAPDITQVENVAAIIHFESSEGVMRTVTIQLNVWARDEISYSVSYWCLESTDVSGFISRSDRARLVDWLIIFFSEDEQISF